MIKIKNTIIYTCNLPSIQSMEDHLRESCFKEPMAHDSASSGFETVLDNRFVIPFTGGYAFKFRFDEKIMPASVTTEMAKKRIAEIEEKEDRRLPKKERNRIREEVVFDLLPRALVNTKRVTCYYISNSNRLIVPISSKKLADAMTSKLIKAVGSIKATTIYINDIKAGLTAKLASFLDGNESSFVEFSVGGQCKIKGDEGVSVSFKKETIEESRDGIIEAIKDHYQVTELSLSTDDIEFRINADFVLKGISFTSKSEETDFDSELDYFQHESSVQTMMIDDVVKKLCQVFEYKESNQDVAA